MWIQSSKRIDQLVHGDADRDVIWDLVRDYVKGKALKRKRWQEGATLMEDLIILDADGFIDRIKATAKSCRAYRRVVVLAHIGGITGPGVERFLDVRSGMEASEAWA